MTSQRNKKLIDEFLRWIARNWSQLRSRNLDRLVSVQHRPRLLLVRVSLGRRLPRRPQVLAEQVGQDPGRRLGGWNRKPAEPPDRDRDLQTGNAALARRTWRRRSWRWPTRIWWSGRLGAWSGHLSSSRGPGPKNYLKLKRARLMLHRMRLKIVLACKVVFQSIHA